MRVLPIAGLVLLAGCRSILGIEEVDLPDAALECRSSADCPGATPACLLPEGTCVQCTAAEAASCTGATPVCDDAAHTCVGCRAHADCASGACLPDGSCADEAEVAYVDGGAPTTATTCTRAAPCHQLAQALVTARPYIKVLASSVVEDTSVPINRSVTIVADPGATLRRGGTGDCLRVEGTSTRVTIQDLALSNLAGSGGSAIYVKDAELTLSRVELSNNAGIGLRVQGGVVRLYRSRLARNLQGGISIENLAASFQVVGNVFVDNGNTGTSSGGVRIKTSLNSPTRRLEHNSFHGNLTGNGGAGIDCDGPLVARNNIVSGPPGTANQQIGGSCSHAYSLFFQLSDGNVPPGTGNQGADPRFVDPAAGDLHLGPGSPALGAADPGSIFDDLSELDIDGERRTQPADVGADEAP
jgi:hypothetical protein